MGFRKRDLGLEPAYAGGDLSDLAQMPDSDAVGFERAGRSSHHFHATRDNKDMSKKHPPSNTQSETQQPEAPKRSHKFVLIGIAVFCVFVAAGATLLTSRYTLTKVSLGGTKLGQNLNDQSYIPELQARIRDYRLALTYPDETTKSYPLSAAGIKVDTEASIKNAEARRAGTAWWQKLKFWENHAIPLVLRTDERTYQKFINKWATQAETAPKNARLVIQRGVAKVAQEKTGQGWQVPNAPTTIVSAVTQLNPEPLKLENSTLTAALTKDNLEPIKDQLNEVLRKDFTFRIAGRTIAASNHDIAGWIDLTPIPSEQTVDITVNSGKVLEYINRISAPYVQTPRTQVTMKLDDGRTKVLVKGINGSDVQNKKKVAETLAEKVLDVASYDSELPVTYASHKAISAQEYDKWLLADVTNKRLYAYEKSKLVKTFLISAGAPGTPTVLGEYKIYNRLVSQDMQGPNTDGSRYYVPNVGWVQYFFESYAIHGNYWRPASYFGNINSSHGCIGLMNDDAKWVFGWAALGTPVIIHD